MSASTANDDNLIWVDLEMTGLDPDIDTVIEIATIVTDSQLNTLAEGPVIAIHTDESRLLAMDEWNTEHHGASGLLDRVRASRHQLADAERETLAFLADWIAPGKSPMCGNSICQDRRFMVRTMPKLEAYFHYRNVDVSTYQGAGAALVTRVRRQLSQEKHPPRPRRHSRIHRRTRPLPQAHLQHLTMGSDPRKLLIFKSKRHKTG